MHWLADLVFSPWINTIFLAKGVGHIYDGRKRLKFEAKKDDRVTQIPDADIRALWQNLSQLNIQFGHFFRWYGGYLIFYAMINVYFYGYLDLAFWPLLDRTMNVSAIVCMLIFMTIGLGLMATNCYSSSSAVSVLLTEDGVNFIEEKDLIFEFYKKMNFVSKNDKVWSNPENRYRASRLKTYGYTYKYSIAGYFIWCPTVILVSSYLTCAQLYLLILN